MKRAIAFALAAVGLIALGYFLGARGKPAETAASAPEPGRKVLYWYDPMYPQQKFDKPGKSPFMDMQLVPRYADDKQDAAGSTAISPRMRQSLGVRTRTAELTELASEMRAVGYVQADERRIARAEVRTRGWVERLAVRAVNEPVRAGQTLAEVYSPELLAAQEEYLLARRLATGNPADASLAKASRRRLELLGLTGKQIERLEQAGTASRRVALLAPISGVVTDLAVREGAMVQAGSPAFTITDLSSVWVVLEVPEAQSALVRPGMRAEARIQSLPEKAFEGRIDYVYPEFNAQTRTLKARLVLANPALALKPGMYASVDVRSSSRKALTVPSEAVIETGARTVVIVSDGERFRPAAVKIGAEANGRTEVIEGLEPGDSVVVSGQFLIDSEASLKTALGRLEGPAPHSAKTERHAGTGKVTGVEATNGRIELDHEPIPSMNWPRMTMGFAVQDRAALAGLKPGDTVEFEVAEKPDKDGNYVISKLRKRP
ncbi:MAG TPA: efflux RND transporter periplasmic adaptor subunit [Burkholderiales bacterium]|jgi:Cu(I)/Ag(I) efflux system membrane fusion protein|nr:efflux RND transporter periplasmic adaptor subunit [Burkholderiales bacterium]